MELCHVGTFNVPILALKNDDTKQLKRQRNLFIQGILHDFQREKGDKTVKFAL